MRLVFVISALSSGGAERVLVSLVKGLAARGHRITVVTIYGRELDFFRLPAGVERVALGLGKDTVGLPAKLTANVRRIRALRRAIRAAEPDAVISLLGRVNVLALAAAARLSVPVIVAEHTDPFREPLPGVWQSLRRITYRRAARVVSVSAAVDSYFDWIAAERRAVIPNPVDFAELDSAAAATALPWPHAILAMGRLAPEKGFDILIEAFAQIAARVPDWGVAILGEGGLRGALESLVIERGLVGRVLLPGAIASPAGTLKKADLFVLSSRWEALPMALIEAMACGRGVVATECMGTAADWLRPGENAIVVPTEDAARLAAAMEGLMQDPDRRRLLGENAAAAVRPFELDRIVGRWETLLDEATATSNPPARRARGGSRARIRPRDPP
jgi:GalNAc-alpha-(1->4)-GalNAc-alpha-(1->3)-diNAcBac-PP-undecaprenol alpha-1,4-N-acetyl-D-galactosaminyltransferase